MSFRPVDKLAIGIAALIAVAIPVWLLWPHDPPAPSMPLTAARPQPVPDTTVLGSHELFGGDAELLGSALPKDAPELAGIIGRPPRDAVALVRTESGGTKSIAPGDSFQGWRLEAISVEAALFSRGPRQIRVPMPVAEAVATSTDQ